MRFSRLSGASLFVAIFSLFGLWSTTSTVFLGFFCERRRKEKKGEERRGWC